MERMITPLLALLLAVPAQAQLLSNARCDGGLLEGALLDPKILPPTALQGSLLKYPGPGESSPLCRDANVWRYAKKGDLPFHTSLTQQLTTVNDVRMAFLSLDQKSNEAIALANELLQKGEKLGLVKKTGAAYTVTSATNLWNLPTKTSLAQKRAAVLELLSTAPAPALTTGWTDLHSAVGSKTKTYYQKLIELRAATRAFADKPVIADAEIKRRLDAGIDPAKYATPSDSYGVIGVMMQTVALVKGSKYAGQSAMEQADADLSDRIARPHMDAQTMLKKYDELIAISYGAKGVAGYLEHIDNKIAEYADKAEAERLEKERQAKFAANLPGYLKTFEEKTIEGLNAGIDGNAVLTPEKKAELKAEYSKGTVVNTGKTLQYTVTGADGKPKVLSETPLPETAEQLTQDNAVLKGKEVAGMILNGQDYLCRLEALIGAITQPDTQPKVEPVTAPDGKTVTPMEQVKEGVPWWRKLIDPFHGKMDKYRKHQLHKNAKEAGESSKERRQRQKEYDDAADGAKTKRDALLFRIENDPALSPELRKSEKEKAEADYQAALKKAQEDSDKKKAANTIPLEQQEQRVQEVDNLISAAYDQQIRAKVAKLRGDYKYDALKRTALAQETKFGVWKIDVERKTNVFTSFLTDAQIDGYFTANWAADNDAASVAACRKALGFEKPDPKAKVDYDDPTYRRVDNRCVHAGLVAHINGLKGKSTVLQPYDPSVTDAEPDEQPKTETKKPKQKTPDKGPSAPKTGEPKDPLLKRLFKKKVPEPAPNEPTVQPQ